MGIEEVTLGWMDERCFRPLLCTVKAELGRGQPGLMRRIWDETLPQGHLRSEYKPLNLHILAILIHIPIHGHHGPFANMYVCSMLTQVSTKLIMCSHVFNVHTETQQHKSLAKQVLFSHFTCYVAVSVFAHVCLLCLWLLSLLLFH